MVSVCLPSNALLQPLPSYLGFSYLGHGVSLHSCSSKAQPLLLTLYEGYLLIAALPDLQHGIGPLGPPAPVQPLLLGRGVGPPGLDLLRFMSIESVMPSNYFIFCHPLLLLSSIFPSIRVFSNESVFCIRCQSIGVSASASVLPINIQDSFPLGWTGWISLLSKELSRVFSNTTVQKHRFFNAQLSL